MKETKEFEANISELLNMIINSFYSQQDVFLRELISNCSDAIEKQKYIDLRNSKMDVSYEIKIDPLYGDNCLVIEDNGVGMNKEELINHLSTIATSGTKEFIKNIKDKSEQIGQFGVGFYSAFLVANIVEVLTTKDNQSWKWTSDANQYYSIEEDFNISRSNGTTIILHLKDDALSFLEENTLRRIITQYSTFITYPIKLHVEKQISEQKVDSDSIVEENVVDDENVVVEENVVDEENVVVDENPIVDENVVDEENPIVEDTKTTTREWEIINGEKPIWYNNPNENTEDQYNNLYKTLSKDWKPPLFWRHFHTEGNYQFKGILYIPSEVPFDMLGERNKEKRNIKLYVKKVLIMDELDKEMLPDWMNFVRGVIDSEDLPLNVSREILQQNKVVKALKTQLKKQVMNMMNDLLLNHDKYKTFYDSFHRYLKLGIHEGDESLMSFLRLKNSSNDNLISLDDYVNEHLKDDQKSIYYITGNSSDNLMVKLYISKGYSIVYFDEPIDEFMLQRTSKYKDFDLINILKDHVTPWKVDDNDDSQPNDFIDWCKKTLNDPDIESIKFSNKLTTPQDDPLCILSSKWGWTGNMEKIMISQPLGDKKSLSFMKGKKILELNKNNIIIQKLLNNFPSDDSKNQLFLLYQCGLLSAGFPIDNAHNLVNNIYQIISSN